jgi:hypothetical protein
MNGKKPLVHHFLVKLTLKPFGNQFANKKLGVFFGA